SFPPPAPRGSGESRALSQSSSGGFRRVLGLRDVVLMNVIAVVGLRWISRSARAGVPSISLWLLALLLFFVPFAAGVIELSRGYQEQGGLYVWVKRALGPLHGFIAGWCYCVNFAFYYVTMLLFAAPNVAAVLGERGAKLADDRTYSVVFVLVLLWALTFVNLLGFSTAKWIQNLGTLGIWIPAGLLVAAGVLLLAAGRPATEF